MSAAPAGLGLPRLCRDRCLRAARASAHCSWRSRRACSGGRKTSRSGSSLSAASSRPTATSATSICAQARPQPRPPPSATVAARRRDRRRDRRQAQRDYPALDALRVPGSAHRRRRRHGPVLHRLLQGPGPAPGAHGGEVRHQRPSARPPHRLQQPCIRLFLLRSRCRSARLAVNPSIRKRQFLYLPLYFAPAAEEAARRPSLRVPAQHQRRPDDGQADHRPGQRGREGRLVHLSSSGPMAGDAGALLASGLSWRHSLALGLAAYHPH